MFSSKTFLIPEMIYDPSLLLNPHVFLLGILFRHRAFASEALNNNPTVLTCLDIHDGEFELPLPLKESMSDVLIFRRAEQSLTGYKLSSRGITLGMMSQWVRTVGEILGFEYTTISYSLRYMAGNTLDRNGKPLSPPFESPTWGRANISINS